MKIQQVVVLYLRSVVGARHARVCVVEDTDPTPVDQISWCKVVRVPRRPF
jgi:hypothetical protein